MANLDQAPSRTMPNLLHILPAFANESELRVNTIVELNSNTINDLFYIDKKLSNEKINISNQILETKCSCS